MGRHGSTWVVFLGHRDTGHCARAGWKSIAFAMLAGATLAGAMVACATSDGAPGRVPSRDGTVKGGLLQETEAPPPHIPVT